MAEQGQDIFYVCQRLLEEIAEKLKKNEEIPKNIVDELTIPEDLDDSELMVPVDMRGAGEEFEDVEQMIEKLGPKGTAEAFIKAREYFEANKDKEPEDERPKPMTAKEWRDVLEEDDLGEGEEEDLLLEGEEEEAELDDDEDDDDGEPAAKKAKTSSGAGSSSGGPAE